MDEQKVFIPPKRVNTDYPVRPIPKSSSIKLPCVSSANIPPGHRYRPVPPPPRLSILRSLLLLSTGTNISQPHLPRLPLCPHLGLAFRGRCRRHRASFHADDRALRPILCWERGISTYIPPLRRHGAYCGWDYGLGEE